jgi:hypothetical protein
MPSRLAQLAGRLDALYRSHEPVGSGMRVERWANCYAVRLTPEVIAALGLREGDEIEIRPIARPAGDGGHEPGTG